MQESHLRSMIKAVSWRIFGTFSTMLITFMVTHQIHFALYVGLFEFISKIGLFYLHERIWNKIPLGFRTHKNIAFNNTSV